MVRFRSQAITCEVVCPQAILGLAASGRAIRTHGRRRRSHVAIAERQGCRDLKEDSIDADQTSATAIGRSYPNSRPNAPIRILSGARETRDLALRIAEVIADSPAANTLVLDIQAISPIADYFVICSGENERQLRAVAREIGEKLEAEGVRSERTEGDPASGWIVLDYGAVIVHVFDVEQREFYRLEELWSEAQTLLTIE